MGIFLNMPLSDLFLLVHVQYILSLGYKQFDKVDNKYEAHLPHVMDKILHVPSCDLCWTSPCLVHTDLGPQTI